MFDGASDQVSLDAIGWEGFLRDYQRKKQVAAASFLGQKLAAASFHHCVTSIRAHYCPDATKFAIELMRSCYGQILVHTKELDTYLIEAEMAS